MNALNRALNSLFDLVLAPLDSLGAAWSLIVVSALFGVGSLVVFKRISSQRRIKSTKDKIKGHLIAIRIYQDDLRVVGQSVGRILGRNVQYLGLNFGPFLPLVIPFVFVMAQFVVRYAYDPVPLAQEGTAQLAGEGTLLLVELAPEKRERIAGLKVHLPPGVKALSPLVRSAADGRAFMELAAVAAGTHAIELELPDGSREIKLLAAGDAAPRSMQPRRVSARDWYRLHDPDHWPALWPAEPSFAADSPFRSVAISYPVRDLGWLPSGEGGILLTFVAASMLFGLLMLKPLGVQI